MRVTIKQRERATVRLKAITYSSAVKATASTPDSDDIRYSTPADVVRRAGEAITGRIADEPTAEAGVDNTKVMSPLRTKQSIVANAETGIFTPEGGGAVQSTIRNALRQIKTAFGWMDEALQTKTIMRTSTDGDIAAFDTAIANIFADLRDGDTVTFPQGLYRLSAQVSTDKQVHVIADGAEFDIAANVTPFRFYAPPAAYDLSADYSPGDLAISVDTMAAALTYGQAFKVVSDAVDPANRDLGSNANQYRCGEWSHAGSGSTTTSIVLQNPLRFPIGVDPVSGPGDEPFVDAYQTTYNARILVLAGKTMSWRGGTIRFRSGNDASWNAAAFLVAGYSEPLIRGLKVPRGYQSGINVVGTYGARVEDCDISHLNDNTGLGQFGYGVADAGYGTVVSKCRFTVVRHGVTTAELQTSAGTTDLLRLLGSGRIQNGLVIDCYGTAGANALFDTHHGAENYAFINCNVDGGAGYAYSFRGRGIKVVNPRWSNTTYGIFGQTEFQGGDPDDDNWVSGKPIGFTTLAIQNAKGSCVARPFHLSRVRRCMIDGWDIECASHQIVKNEGSSVKLAGTRIARVSDFDGAVPITTITGEGAFDVKKIDASLTATADWFAEIIATGIDIIDLTAATDGANNLLFCRVEDSTCRVDVRGEIDAALSGDFSGLLSGSVSAYQGSESGLLNWSVDGAADNSITLGLLGTRLRAAAKDGSAWWDGAGIAKGSESLVYRDLPAVASAGTGIFVTNVYTPAFAPASVINEAGHYARFVIDLIKTGATGAATIRARTVSGSAFIADAPMAATDLYCRVEIDIYTTGASAQSVVVRSQSGPNPGAVASTLVSRSFETANLAAGGGIIKFDVNAAVGDTITFEVIRVYSDVPGFGV